jgi:hypothetical protein
MRFDIKINKMKKIFFLVTLSILCVKSYSQKTDSDSKEFQPVQVLNFGTFHMGFTNDETTTEFDENDQNNQNQAREIAKQLAEFKPTVIIVERPPRSNEKLLEIYNRYIQNPDMEFKYPTEIELIAYEAGRLSGTKRIYGVDHKMGYNYNIGNDIKNSIDSIWHDKFFQDPLSYYPDIDSEKGSNKNLSNQLKQINHDQYLDFLITVNADILTHAGTKDGFEGADEAAKYYQRNLRMFSNLNRLELTQEDRVFILMGASHTAFFRDFISRNPKYKMVDTFKYLD